MARLRYPIQATMTTRAFFENSTTIQFEFSSTAELPPFVEWLDDYWAQCEVVTLERIIPRRDAGVVAWQMPQRPPVSPDRLRQQ